MLFPTVRSDSGSFHHEEEQRRNEGDVTIENSDDKQKVVDKKEGEYIDYEEID